MSGAVTMAPAPFIAIPAQPAAVPPASNATVVQPNQTTAPLISSSPATQATAAGAGGAAAAVLVLLIWLLSMVHVTVPGEAAAAMSTLLGIGVHWVVLKYGLPVN